MIDEVQPLAQQLLVNNVGTERLAGALVRATYKWPYCNTNVVLVLYRMAVGRHC